jgi:cyclic beta-1,2-glucan synthetase
VSDVYQDLFGEGSFTGKGIYDVDAFTAALAGKVPDSSLLSHDLFEGVFARAGLVTDVELFEEFPSHFEAAAARQHRWARGDWQLLPWIFGRRRTAIPVIGRFKMLDNLRRTLLAPATILTLVAGRTLPAASPGIWTGFVLATMALPSGLRFLAGVIPRRRGISKRSHLQAVAGDLVLAAAQVGLTVAFSLTRPGPWPTPSCGRSGGSRARAGGCGSASSSVREALLPPPGSALGLPA